MPLSLVQQVADGAGESVSTLSFSFTQTTEGNLLVIRIVSDSVVTTPTDWTRVIAGTLQADVVILARRAPAGTFTSQNVACNSADAVGLFSEYSGAAGTTLNDCLDQTASSTNSTTSGTTGTTTQADELALAVLGAGGNASGTWSAQSGGYTEDADLQSAAGGGTEVTGGFYSLALSSTGTQSVSATNSAPNNQRSGCIATFKAAAGGGATDVTPADAAHGHTADQPALTQVHALTSNDATHGHTADQPTLAQVHQIAVDSATHAHTAEQPTITSGAELAVDDATHAHTAEQPALTQLHVLAPADAVHAHSAAEPSLTTVGDLVAHDATHAHTADVAPLTGTHELVPNDAAHGHTAEQPSLSSGLVIVPADALHAHTAEQPALTQLHLLIAADALHGHAADSAVLTQLHVLVVADALHGHTADQATVADQGESRDITVAATLTAPRWAAAMIAQAVAAVTPGARWTAVLEED